MAELERSLQTLPGKLTVVETATKPSAAEHGIHVTLNADNETNNGVTVRVVNRSSTTSANSNGINVESENAGVTTKGLYARGHLASGRSATGDVIGVDAISTVYSPAREAFGTKSMAAVHPGSELTQDAFGVYGLARIFTDSENFARILYGVHGRVIEPFQYNQEQRDIYGETNTCKDCWAGYFKGRVKITGDGFVNGNFMITSDQNFKTNVQNI